MGTASDPRQTQAEFNSRTTLQMPEQLFSHILLDAAEHIHLSGSQGCVWLSIKLVPSAKSHILLVAGTDFQIYRLS